MTLIRSEWLEILVVLTTLLYNYYLIKQKIICWVFGFLSSFFGLIVFYEKQLIGQVILHVFYLLMAIYGGIIWKKNKQLLMIKQWNLIHHLYTIGLGILITTLLGKWVLPTFTNHINFLDIGITVFCFIATFKEAHKILSAWLYWIVLNLASMALYFQSNLKIYALLMCVYTLLSIKGYWVWRNEILKQKGL